FTASKSALLLLLVALALTQMTSGMRRLWSKCALCFAPVVMINVVTLGSVVSDSLAGIVNLLPFDPTFTGRADIWQFALDSIGLNPIKGYGYAVFWENSSNQTAIDGSIRWAAGAAHSHNGYLELALTTGLPGLALFLLIFVVSPLLDFHRVQQHGQDPE